MLIKCSFIFIGVMLCCMANAQSIEGIWKGKEVADGDSCYLEVVLQLNSDNRITGETFLLFSNGKFQRFSFTGVFNNRDSALQFKETKTIASSHNFFDANCFGNYKLSLKKTDTAFLLSGACLNYMHFMKILCAKGSITLSKRFPDTSVYALSKSISSPAKDTAALYTERKTESAATIISKADTIHIKLYDNGVIDHDTVSLYFNDRLLLFKKELQKDAIVFDIYLDKSLPVNKLFFVAENLGDIPPNTGVMIIRANDKQYEVDFSADLYTNSSVDFIFKKEKRGEQMPQKGTEIKT